jgi:15-cis-phytoene synthase
MKALFDTVSIQCSRLTTKAYSTSFSIGILCLEKKLRDPIHSIYGFVRFADEIVDSFEGYPKSALLTQFKTDTYKAIADQISLNPILNSFQATVNQYQISSELIDLFLKSMEMDLVKTSYDNQEYNAYILGSAEVVGLMCLKIFCYGDNQQYERLKPYAMKLGSAFQKVNFLRDLRDDFIGLGRTYFPDVQITSFDESSKRRIEESISRDFAEAFAGIKQLPRGSRFGVYIAYVYYLALFRKIRNTPSDRVLKSRISIKKREKARLLAYSYVKHQLNMI